MAEGPRKSREDILANMKGGQDKLAEEKAIRVQQKINQLDQLKSLKASLLLEKEDLIGTLDEATHLVEDKDDLPLVKEKGHEKEMKPREATSELDKEREVSPEYRAGSEELQQQIIDKNAQIKEIEKKIVEAENDDEVKTHQEAVARQEEAAKQAAEKEAMDARQAEEDREKAELIESYREIKDRIIALWQVINELKDNYGGLHAELTNLNEALSRIRNDISRFRSKHEPDKYKDKRAYEDITTNRNILGSKEWLAALEEKRKELGVFQFAVKRAVKAFLEEANPKIQEYQEKVPLFLSVKEDQVEASKARHEKEDEIQAEFKVLLGIEKKYDKFGSPYWRRDDIEDPVGDIRREIRDIMGGDNFGRYLEIAQRA